MNPTPPTGLTQIEAEKILASDGYNELVSQKKRNGFFVLLHIMAEPMLLLLLVCGVIYLFLGEVTDALMLLTFIMVVIGITFYQEQKTEKTLAALRDLSSPRALVIRDGEQKRIPGREVARGDLIILREGDRVPADATMLSCENLAVDESLLTGESVSVRKAQWDGKLNPERPGGDDLPFVYAGSLVVSGRGLAQVHLTGMRTEIGKIGRSLESIKDEDTLLHKETRRIVRVIAAISLVLCIVVVLVYALVKGSIMQGLLAGLTLSMSLLPEEFPVVLLIFLTLGAWRISKRQVLTRRPAAIETLGAATILCTDKTGTLTMNKMELTSLGVSESYCELNDLAGAGLPEKFHPLLEYGILASQRDPFDPIDKELNRVGELYLTGTTHLHENWMLAKEYPLSKELLALSHVWHSPNEQDYVIAAKGAPEAILDLCHASAPEKQSIIEQVTQMSKQGLRILAVAKAFFSQSDLPDSQHHFAFEFVGLLGFIDPARPTAASAVAEAYAAGMRVIMITGDYPGTAQFIAREIGIKNSELYLTGDDLRQMDQSALQQKIKITNIFARVLPEQKLLIVSALKANGEVVAMTGDGVNDAPALKAAHIGIAMGERGTDVAREASALVLLNDDFSSIVSAVRLGRRIYTNLKHAMGYILAVHVPIAGMSLLPLVFNLPPVLLPAHIAFLELIIDPACSTVFESVKEEPGIMRRSPRDLRQPMFSLKTVGVSLVQGLGVLAGVFVLYLWATKTGHSETVARSMAFASLVLANLMLIIMNLSWTKNIYQIFRTGSRVLFIVCGGTIISLLLVLYIPQIARLFHLAPLGGKEFMLIGVVVVISVLWFEMLKFIRKHSTAR